MKKNAKRTGTKNFILFNYFKFFFLEKSVANLGDALDSIIRLTTTNNSTDDSYNFQTDFV